MTVAPPPADPQQARGLSIADRLSLPRIHWGWLLLLIAFGALFWASRSVIGPFVAGFVVAYLLDPPAQWLERHRWPRWLASVSVLLLFIVAIVGIGLAALPIIEAQILQLIKTLPTLVQTSLPIAEKLLEDSHVSDNAQQVIANLGNRAVGWLTDSLGTIVAGSLAFVNVLTFVVITPIVAFYLLRDWPKILAQVESWWPRAQLPVIKDLLRQSDAALSGFVRGQSLVCLILAIFYAAGWSLIGLDYAIVLGLLAGILGFVPFLGVLFAVVMSLLVSLGDEAASHSGALLKMLMPLAERGVNLSKIESRPSKKRPWDYFFFLDVSGHYEDAAMKAALAELRASCPLVKWLGSYPAAN